MAGVRESVKMMGALTREAKKSDIIRRQALQLTAGLRPKAFGLEIFALFNFVQTNIRYVGDIAGIETLTAPVETLRQRAGDCDDATMLLAALLESIGHPTRFFAMGFKRGELTHVIVETKFRHRPTNPHEDPDWLPLDPTEPFDMGWLPPGIMQRMYRNN